jgi:3-hydroxyacyl-[acyl-carrier-protein] dehydratase
VSTEPTALWLDWDGLHEYQQNRPPFLMLDEATEVVPGVSARGYKQLSGDEFWFPVHFPGNPMMPASLQIEAIVQLAALTVLTLPGNKGQLVYLAGATNLKFARRVVPGDRLDFDTKLLTWKRGIGTCSGTASVGGELASQGEFRIVMPSILDQFRVQAPPPNA